MITRYLIELFMTRIVDTVMSGVLLGVDILKGKVG
jgi:hypothetical protein